MKTIAQILDETIPRTTRSVLSWSGTPLSAASQGADTDYDLIVLIGFSGDYNGTLGFAATQSILKADDNEADRVITDGWLGEVGNRLLGKLKNDFLAYGVELHLHLPKVLHGVCLQVRPRNKQVRQYVYDTGQGQVCVWVDAEWDADQDLEEAAPDQYAMEEGHVYLC